MDAFHQMCNIAHCTQEYSCRFKKNLKIPLLEVNTLPTIWNSWRSQPTIRKYNITATVFSL